MSRVRVLVRVRVRIKVRVIVMVRVRVKVKVWVWDKFRIRVRVRVCVGWRLRRRRQLRALVSFRRRRGPLHVRSRRRHALLAGRDPLKRDGLTDTFFERVLFHAFSSVLERSFVSMQRFGRGSFAPIRRSLSLAPSPEIAR